MVKELHTCTCNLWLRKSKCLTRYCRQCKIEVHVHVHKKPFKN